METGDQKTWVHDVVQDLLQRQVDTILTDGVVGRGMPHPLIALLDINNAYFRKLMQLGVLRRDASGALDWPAAARDDDEWLLPNVAAMQWLMTKASLALKDATLKAPDRCILVRIVSTTTALMPMVRRLEERNQDWFTGAALSSKKVAQPAPPRAADSRAYQAALWSAQELPSFELTRRESSALSKAWELGADTIAIQTVMMVDGDIITRIADKYSGEPYGIVRQIHKEAVSVSLATWELLANAAGGLVRVLFDRAR